MKSPFEFKIFAPKTAGLLMVGMNFPRKSIQALATLRCANSQTFNTRSDKSDAFAVSEFIVYSFQTDRKYFCYDVELY